MDGFGLVGKAWKELAAYNPLDMKFKVSCVCHYVLYTLNGWIRSGGQGMERIGGLQSTGHEV